MWSPKLRVLKLRGGDADLNADEARLEPNVYGTLILY
jgi:hypothetical protein